MLPGPLPPGGAVSQPDDVIMLLWSMLETEEWLQDRSEREGGPASISQLTWAHVELYATLCAAEERQGAEAAALRQAFLHGAATMLELVKAKRAGASDYTG